VRRVAPVAAAPASALNPNVPLTAPAPPPTQNTVCVYCSVEPRHVDDTRGLLADAATDDASVLRPGMTGFARIDCGRTTAGRLLLEKGMQMLRTEFW
jgi:hypothetical protein